MKESSDDNSEENNDRKLSDNIRNASIVNHMREMSVKEDAKSSSSRLVLKQKMKHLKKSNKLNRYKIGLIFYLVYLLMNIVELITTIIYKFDFDLHPFGETYLRFSSLILFLFLAPFLNKTNSSKLYDMINITKYYIPDWKNKKDGNLSSVFYVFEGTEEKFNKTVHKISFLLMVLIYFSESFYLLSYIKGQEDIQAYNVPILYPLGSILIIIFLRNYFLHTQDLDLLNKISLVLIFISIIFLFVFQMSIFKYTNTFDVFGFSFIGGVFFGMFSTFLKYYANIYGHNFKFLVVLGYIGLFTMITVPFILSLICLSSKDLETNFNVFHTGNKFIPYLIIFVCSFIKFISSFHCIISLSPLVFSFAMLFRILLNFAINIMWGYIESNWKFYTAGILLILGVGGGILDKYLKYSIRASQSKKQLSKNFKMNEKPNDLLLAELAGTEINNAHL